MKNKDFITTSQMVSILVGTMIGSGVLYLPLTMVRITNQNAWIYAALGVIYPLYLVGIVLFLYNQFPKENILSLNKKCFGKFLGNLINVLFLVQYVINVTLRCAQLSNLLRVFMVYFLTPKIVISLTILGAAYVSYHGLHSIARLNEFAFYFTLPIIFVSLGVLPYGELDNLMPIGFQDASLFIRGVLSGCYNFWGIEILLLIYPYMKDKSQLKKAGFICIGICTTTFMWLIFISIYYLGIDSLPKFLWPVVFVTKALNLRAIKNFTYIFLLLWVPIVVKNIANNYYAIGVILNSIFSKIKKETYIVCFMPVIFLIAMNYGNEVITRIFLRRVVPFLLLFDVCMISLTAIMVLVKRGKINENT